MRPDDIAGYVYRADLYCPTCIGRQVLAHEQAVELIDCGSFDNAGNLAGSPEGFLDCVAEVLSIDRYDERSFDSGDFPKAVFASQVESSEECCGDCLCPLVDD